MDIHKILLAIVLVLVVVNILIAFFLIPRKSK
jgi:hypothetical protein